MAKAASKLGPCARAAGRGPNPVSPHALDEGTMRRRLFDAMAGGSSEEEGGLRLIDCEAAAVLARELQKEAAADGSRGEELSAALFAIVGAATSDASWSFDDFDSACTASGSS